MDSIPYLDFHCHLDSFDSLEQRISIVERCLQNGFYRLISVIDPYRADSSVHTIDLSDRFPILQVAVAAHPHEADHYDAGTESRIVDLIKQGRIVAVGEAGLDFHYQLSTPENQERVFRRQIAIAREHGLPLIIHSRNAEKEILRLLDLESFRGPVVFHCFTGDENAAAEIVSRGYGISFSGIVTFKKAESLRRIAAGTPLSHIFCETDSPYLSPEPRRGQVNTPESIPLIVKRLAEIREMTVSAMAEAIKSNYRRYIDDSE